MSEREHLYKAFAVYLNYKDSYAIKDTLESVGNTVLSSFGGLATAKAEVSVTDNELEGRLEVCVLVDTRNRICFGDDCKRDAEGLKND
jgi:hypothetical protein